MNNLRGMYQVNKNSLSLAIGMYISLFFTNMLSSSQLTSAFFHTLSLLV